MKTFIFIVAENENIKISIKAKDMDEALEVVSTLLRPHLNNFHIKEDHFEQMAQLLKPNIK